MELAKIRYLFMIGAAARRFKRKSPLLTAVRQAAAQRTGIPASHPRETSRSRARVGA